MCSVTSKSQNVQQMFKYQLKLVRFVKLGDLCIKSCSDLSYIFYFPLKQFNVRKEIRNLEQVKCYTLRHVVSNTICVQGLCTMCPAYVSTMLNVGKLIDWLHSEGKLWYRKH